MKIVLTAGGSGGHITPLIAIALELKKQQPNCHITYIGQKGDSFTKLIDDANCFDDSYFVRAGKFRRFHNEGFKQFLDIATIYKNIRDLFYVLIGIGQSYSIMKKIKPDIVFSRGGYVSVPVCLGAKLNGINYITHDSDPIPSLANRLIAPWATTNAVSLPPEVYPYKPSKTINTGVPINQNFSYVNKKAYNNAREQINVPLKSKVVFIVGGGQGSQILNNAAMAITEHLINQFEDLYIILAAGDQNLEKVEAYFMNSLTPKQQEHVRLHGFINNMYEYSAAADIIVTRAGATNLAEFALQGKACIVVPSNFLTGGHQLKNAAVLADKGACLIMDESDLIADANKLAKMLVKLLENPSEIVNLASNLHLLAKPEATYDLAKLILNRGNINEIKT